MAGPLKHREAQESWLAFEDSLLKMHKDMRFSSVETGRYGRQLACLNGEFLSQLAQTVKCVEDVKGDRPLWRTYKQCLGVEGRN